VPGVTRDEPPLDELVRRRALAPSAVAALAPASLFRLDGRAAAVTGGAGEIGGWLAGGLAAAGARVALVDVDAPGLERVAATLRQAGAEVALVHADLTEAGAPARCVEATVEAFGSLDVLVNCAVINRREPLVDVEAATFDRLMAVDLRAPYLVAQAAARSMIAAGRGGAIVNVGSVTVAIGLQDVSVYGAAKAALAQLTKTMAVEWSHHGIRVNCLCPGFMMTELSEPVWHAESRRRWLLDRIPMRRPGRPDELVGPLLLLAGEAGGYMTGQTVFADGGFLAGSRWDDAG
jgi:NAD(P)-dependent dehydrogenase (short-subunit alcohol dehydrogenase family)